MQIKDLFLILIPAFVFAGCSGSTTQVAPLLPETETLISQNIANGRLPSPSEVKTQNLTPAENACGKFKTSIPAGWIQGSVEVPEDSANSSGPQIHVFYYGRVLPSLQPTVFFNGGPTQNSHSAFVQLTQKQIDQDPENKISFIFIDQRGTGCSDLYPEDTARLSHYGSREIVNDAEAVRRSLKIEKWNSFGQSFGAFVVHRYASQAPTSLSSAFAHGSSLNADSGQRLKERILSQLRITELYLKSYPEDRARFQSLKLFLKPDTCFSGYSGVKPICGGSILQIFASRLLGFTDQWNMMHQWLEALVPAGQVDPDALSTFLSGFYFSSGNPLNASALAGEVIDHVDRNVIPVSSESCRQIEKELPALASAPSHECLRALETNMTAGSNNVAQLKTDWLLPAAFAKSLLQNPSLNFYLYSGQKDAYVPVASFAEELKATAGLPNFHYTNFLNSGHEGFLTESQIWQDQKAAL